MFVINRRHLPTIRFDRLNVGDTFQNEDGDVFVKVLSHDAYDNALMLGASFKYDFDPDRQVTPVTIKCTVKVNYPSRETRKVEENG